MKRVISTRKYEKGQGFAEYTLIAALVGIIVIGAMTAFGPQIKSMTISLVSSLSGISGYSLQDGVLIIPGLGPTLTPNPLTTPIASSTPISTFTHTPVPTVTHTPVPTFTPIPSPTPTIPACISGSAIVANKSACIELSQSNNCESYTYKNWNKKCTWH